MRTAIVTASLLALALSAWPAEAAAPTAPKCSAADMKDGIASSGGFLRFCGPARAVLRVAGTSFTFAGGRCTATRAGFGMFAPTPSNARAFELVLAHHQRRSGPNPVIDGIYQLPGVSPWTRTPSGTAIIARNLKSATFSLETAGPLGPVRITGSWTCGTARLAP